jgi:simple sugar transport system permease protein
LRALWPSAASIASSLLLCWLAIGLTRVGFSNATAAYGQMLWGGLGDVPRFLSTQAWSALTLPWGETAVKATLLMLTGLSVSVAFAVGLFNIGAQGQLVVGAITAAVLGARVHLPAPLHVPLCLLSAAVAGGLYGFLPALLKLKRGVHEVISTIMLNWVAITLVENWLVVGPLRAVSEGTQSRSGTAPILPSAELPRLLGDLSRLHLGFPIALMVALATWVWLLRTWHGFETRAVGLSSSAAETAGIPVARRVGQAMALSGALAGLAGAILVQGTEHQYPAVLTAPYGFDGIAMAMLGQGHPLGTAVISLVFGALRAGGTRMQLLGVHKSFPELIQGVALLFIAGRLAWDRLGARLFARVQTPTPAAAPEP